jgi:hypothetical protein
MSMFVNVWRFATPRKGVTIVPSKWGAILKNYVVVKNKL